MTRGRRWLTLGCLSVLIAVAVWWLARDPAPTEGPVAVPPGETTRQTLPDHEGNPEVWTLSRREAEREEALDTPLPEPSPRETDPGERTESARALNAEALEAWKQKDLVEALELFEAAVEADPDDWVPRADYGRLLMMMMNSREAQIHLERAAELAPDEPQVWLDLHTLYQRNLRLEPALEARRKAEEAAGGQAIVQDEMTGLWVLEGESVYP